MQLACRLACVLAACGTVPASVPAGVPGESDPPTPLGRETPSPQTSRYGLFDPAPRGPVRETRTARPDAFAGPFALDAGRFPLSQSILPPDDHADGRRAAPARGRARPAEGIQDNSFFVEEAYNQEPRVVQHVLNLSWDRRDADGRREDTTALTFTQEWPLFSQTHQLSYTVPYSFLDADDGESGDGIGDVLLNYRLQALRENDALPAVAPRLSLILPTRDADEGFGNDTVGLQFNLPVSKVVHDRWTLHGNAGVTWLPDVQGQALTRYSLGASAVYAVTSEFNLLVEWVGSWDEHVTGAGESERGFATFISPGLRYAINLPQDAQLVLGVAVPIGLNSEAADYGAFFYLSFEHGF